MRTDGLAPSAGRILAVITGLLTFSQASLGAELALSWLDREGKSVASMTLDLNDLDGLSQAEISTSTPWSKGVDVFSGPTLSDLSLLAGLAVDRAELRALNDYSVEVPKEDWLTYQVIVSTRINGIPPRIYEKGPFWLIYPVDEMTKPLPKKYASRMIWQIKEIEFRVE